MKKAILILLCCITPLALCDCGYQISPEVLATLEIEETAAPATKRPELAPLPDLESVLGPSPEPTPAPTLAPGTTATPTASPSPTPTTKPTATPRRARTVTPRPTSIPRPEVTPTPKPTNTPKPTATPKPTKTPKATAVPKPGKATPTPKVTATPTPSPAPSGIAGTVIGRWENLTEMTNVLREGLVNEEMNETWAALGIQNFGDYVNVRPSTMKMLLTLDGNGKVLLDIDRDAYNTMIQTYAEDVVESLVHALEDVFRKICDEEGCTLEELYNEYGAKDIYELVPAVIEMSLEDFRDSIVEQVGPELESALGTFPMNGTYTVNGDTVSISYSDGSSEKGSYDASSDIILVVRADGNHAFTRIG